MEHLLETEVIINGGDDGFVHMGRRCLFSNIAVERKCREEKADFKRRVPHHVKDLSALFWAVEGGDERYITGFSHLCALCGVPFESLEMHGVCERKPAFSARIIAVFQLRVTAIDPFKISLENSEQPRRVGSPFLQHTRLVEFKTSRRKMEALFDSVTGMGSGFVKNPRHRLEMIGSDEPVLCGCEIVSGNAINNVIQPSLSQNYEVNVPRIGLYSRTEVSGCQEAFRGLNVPGELHETGKLSQDEGLRHLDRHP